MLGFSMYLGTPLTQKDRQYLLKMKKAGFKKIFTSLQLSEEDPKTILQQVKILANWAKQEKLDIIADVSEIGLKRLKININNLEQMKDLNLAGFRIDDGIPMDVVAKLSQHFLIALNASTVSEKEIDSLRKHKADFEKIEAWHNYYPRPETGLDFNWVKERNIWLNSQGLTTMGFISGDNILRGPVYAGLPTLEQDRSVSPLAAYLDLKAAFCDDVFIGDDDLSDYSCQAINTYLQSNCLTLRLEKENYLLTDHTWHNRPDVARDVVRLKEARFLNLFDPKPTNNNLRRHLGDITLDNELYGRYQQEIQIVKKDLPANPKINTINRIVEQDQAILPFIGANQAIKFI